MHIAISVRRNHMRKLLGSFLPFALAAALLTGCTLPGMEKKEDDTSMIGDYNYTPVDTEEETLAYSWIMQPSIDADNIIVFDGSQVDPDNEKNPAYKNYAVIYNNGKYGLIDYKGNIVVDAEYDDYFTCWCGEIVLMNTIDEKNGEYEYCTIDEKNQINESFSFHKNNAPKYYWDTDKEKVYYQNSNEDYAYEYTGKKAVAVTEAAVTTDDYGNLQVSVAEGALCGLAKKGELLTGLEYVDYYAPAYKGAGSTCIAFKNTQGKWGYLDSDGAVIIDFKMDGDMTTYNGRLIDDESKSHPYLFNGDYVPVSEGGFWGYYDLEGNCVVNTGEFGQARPVQNGRAWVRQNDMWGIIQLGEIVEEEPKKLEESSKATTTTTTTWWTTTTSDTSAAETSWTETTTVWSDTSTDTTTQSVTAWTDTTAADTGAVTDISQNTALTDPVYTDAPVDTQAPVAEDPAVVPEVPAVPDAPADQGVL